ncbi:16S rRNA-processing protein RimM [Gracilibacillus halophilus YIM-C55.5]|uniref:Ribosome maturation factor RimM n=1 Tax=Gracilibacillus halophilus YIM-C55.5 TaxID=1308866 RepID=N4WQ47_9BACI|nr:ribosome maturation factor RimM [Gracilibacillus halophilus]ENH98262.1 16S rRNA-processing protein RimM [Gracilibacillus halophilus YIM-C55.5]
MSEEFLNVGKITNTHGIKGEVKVIRITDFDERFEPGAKLWLGEEKQSEYVPVTVAHHRLHKQFDLLQFKEFRTINEVEPFKGAMIKVNKDELPSLAENEFYYYQIIGCSVYTLDNNYVGEIKEILSPGANDVWVVTDQENEYYIPYIADIVKKIDVTQQLIWIEPMEGLFD